jgi:hypothetical protein
VRRLVQRDDGGTDRMLPASRHAHGCRVVPS